MALTKGRQTVLIQNYYASIASDGAAGTITIGAAPGKGFIANAYLTPTGAAQGGHAASYRTAKIYDGGTAGSGTTLLYSKAFTSTDGYAAHTPQALTGALTRANDPDYYLDKGDNITLAFPTTGGAKNTETVVPVGKVQVLFVLVDED